MQKNQSSRGHSARVMLAVLMLGVSTAMAADKTGFELVEQVCAACHATGKDGAPMIGDVGAWTQHAKQGLGKLAEHAISGLGNMPGHGGQPALSDLEISRAIAYMVSFGHGVDPTKPYASARTGLNNLSDTDVRNAVIFTIVQSATAQAHWRPLDLVQELWARPNRVRQFENLA